MVRSKFRGRLEMSKEFNININVYSKTAESKIQTLKKHSLVTEQTKLSSEGKII